jgi:hypothetical protein
VSEAPDGDPWPVVPSNAVGATLEDPALPAELFSAVVALTVAIAENPWLEGSTPLEGDPNWREILIPNGRGIAEYRINEDAHTVTLTRVVPF